jgi:hypothetical protein
VIPLAQAGLVLCTAGPPRPHASGDPLRLLLSTAQDVELRLARADGAADVRLWTADGSARSRLGWMPDLDPAPGRVMVSFAALHLPAGPWQVSAGGCTATLQVSAADGPAGRPVAGAEGPVLATRVDREGLRLAWTPEGAEVPAGGGWDLRPLHGAPPRVARSAGGAGPVQLEPIRPNPRPPAARHDGAVRSALLPVTVLVLAGAAVGLAGALRRRGAAWLLAAAALAALVATGGALTADVPTLLATGGPVSDPTDSVAQLAALVDALPALSSATGRFSAPEGAGWLTVGPSWLAYLPVVPLAAWLGPVRAQTAGIALGAALLALCTGLLARSRGARPTLAAAAGLLAALAPAIVDEWDAMSLDRSALWAAPLALLALDRAAAGARGGVVGAALALVAGLLGQVYYGLLLALSAPAFAALRWAPRAPGARHRLGRLALAGALAAVLAAPVLWTLRAGTADTGYGATAPLAERIEAVTTPLSADEATTLAGSGRRGRGYRSFDLSTARARVLAAGSMSLSAEEALAPRGWLPGGAWAWPLLLAAVLLAPDRRRASVALAEVAVLMTLSLGPFLHIGGRPGAGLTPWGALAIALPGFDQLKNIDRAALLAATLAPAVLALGAEGLVRRLEGPLGQHAGRGLAVGLAAAMLLGPAGLRWQDGRPVRAGVAIRTQAWPAHPGLQALRPGAVVSLPLDGPVAAAQAVPVLEAGLGLVNAPPFEVPPDAPGPWSDDLPLLNQLATLSGDVRGTRPLPPGDPAADLRVLAEAGVTGIALHADRMPGPSTAAAATALLDGLLPRTGEARGVIVWAVPPAPGG